MTTLREAAAALPDHSLVPPVWGRITNLEIERGEGSWLITPDGERYLDYSSGIGVTSTGHAHPRVAAAIADQAAKLIHGQQNIVYHEPGLRLHERLSHILPGDDWGVFLSGMDMFIQNNFFNIPYQVALVVDPRADTLGFFQWKHRRVTPCGFFYIYDR